MTTDRYFDVDEKQARVIVTDDPEAAEEYVGRGICCIGISGKDTFFEGVSFVAEKEEDVDDHLLRLAWCRFHHIPFAICQEHDLICRESILSDYDALAALSYEITDVLFPPKDIFNAYIENAYGFWGYGLWTVLIRNSDDEWEIAGWCGLMPSQQSGAPSGEMVTYQYGEPGTDQDPPELGFVIRKDLRGSGIAKRTCRAIMAYAREYLGVEWLILRTDERNEAARALAHSLGFVILEPASGSDPKKHIN